MSTCERHIKCAVAGDSLASPEILVHCMRSEWKRQDVMISSESPFSFSLKSSRNLNESMMVHFSFQILTSPPQTLVTGSDILILVFSPAHPLSFLHLWEVWWPLFSHLRQLPYLIVANNMELLVTPQVQQYMHKYNIHPILFEEVLQALNAAMVSHNNFYPISRINMKDLLLQDSSSVSNTSLSYLCDALLCTSCSQSVHVEVPLQSRWEMALEEGVAHQLMIQLLDEWIVVTSPLLHHVFYANRRTKEVTTIKPVELSNTTMGTPRKEKIHSKALVPQANCQKHLLGDRLAKNSTPPKEYLKNLEEVVGALRKKRSELKNIEDHVQYLRKGVIELKQQILVLQSRIDNSKNDIVSIVSNQEALKKEFHSLQEQCDQIGTINELTLSTLSEETDELRKRYLNVWHDNRKTREKIARLHEKVHDAQEKVKIQQYQLQNQVESKLSLLRSRFVTHYTEIDELEQKSLLLYRWQALRGRRTVFPQDTSEKYKTRPTYISQEWFSFLRGLSQALISTVEPLLSASEKLRIFYETHLVYQRSFLRTVTTLQEGLHRTEMLQRRRIAVEQTLEFASCILDDFLLPVQRHGRCLGQRVATRLQLLPLE
ncbi:uncharacterized protein TM35_000021140 [Trypanosoma theileri]|uniref:Uncharacterized protein n=1 Tax=Trypanosoma theileri TaxID=67003 RepID=A0A1X0P7E0_9TRYP|nr:uncharacterized protein TM35_000021140 [Trypanosoma theileri]ORC92788.1 hypothetical protein TM35_000021140 [Trypanosoma theileri]